MDYAKRGEINMTEQEVKSTTIDSLIRIRMIAIKLIDEVQTLQGAAYLDLLDKELITLREKLIDSYGK